MATKKTNDSADAPTEANPVPSKSPGPGERPVIDGDDFVVPNSPTGARVVKGVDYDPVDYDAYPERPLSEALSDAEKQRIADDEAKRKEKAKK